MGLKTILDSGSEYGRQATKDHPRILLEFISANPTGPLHVGHGRHAAYGASVGNLLVAAGFPVHREYYVNDAGRQMDILGASVWLRWLESNDVSVPFPKGGYRGEYIRVGELGPNSTQDELEAPFTLREVVAKARAGGKSAPVGIGGTGLDGPRKA